MASLDENVSSRVILATMLRSVAYESREGVGFT